MSNENKKDTLSQMGDIEQFGIRLTPELKEKHIEATKLEEHAAEMDVVARDEVERAARMIREAKAAAELAENKAIILDKEELMEQEIAAQIVKDEQELEIAKNKLEADKVRHNNKLEDIRVASEEAKTSQIQANELSEKADEALEKAKKIVIKAQVLKVESETARAAFVADVERLHAEKRVEEAKIAEENARRALELAETQKANAATSQERYDLLREKLEEASKYDIDLDMDIKTLNKQKADFEASLNEVNEHGAAEKPSKKTKKEEHKEEPIVEATPVEETIAEAEAVVQEVQEQVEEPTEVVEIQEPADEVEFNDEVISEQSYEDPFDDEVEYKETAEEKIEE